MDPEFLEQLLLAVNTSQIEPKTSWQMLSSNLARSLIGHDQYIWPSIGLLRHVLSSIDEKTTITSIPACNEGTA